MSQARSIAFYAAWLVLVLIGSTAADHRDGGLMPMPMQIEFGTTSFLLVDQLGVFIEGHSDERLSGGIDRFFAHLTAITGQPLGRHEAASEKKAKLVITCASGGEVVQGPDESEGYVLSVSSSQIRLTALTVVGVMRGLATLEQLVQNGSKSFVIPEVQIQDKPRFVWRGLLIDVCRHWQPMDVILRNLDAMAAVKLNVLHLHLTEDQGFRVESERFPRLTDHGSEGNYYTQRELRDLVAYARDRGIRVVPEFDMPGHTTSWLVGYPELAAAPGPFKLERRWGVFDPCFDPTNEVVYEFLDAFLEEMTTIFPDRYVHIGGDEVNGNLWNSNSKIQEFLKAHSLADNHALQAHFNGRIATMLGKYDKTMIGWDEILHDELPRSCLIQSWRNADSLKSAAKQGFNGILSSGFYLDHQRPASFHYVNDPDPKGGSSADTHPGRILGGEACMWAEYVTPETIDSRIWPRLAVIAERLWSPASVNDVDDMYRRLENVSHALDLLGVKHRVHQDRMLRRLAGRHPIDSLRVLASVVEPVKFYQRSAARTYTNSTPLNRLVDASQPESQVARKFHATVKLFLTDRRANADAAPAIRTQLETWRDNHDALLPTIRASHLLKEVEPVSHKLRSISILGLQAVDLIQTNRQPSEAWKTDALTELNNAAKPGAEVEIALVPTIRKLVESIRSTD